MSIATPSSAPVEQRMRGIACRAAAIGCFAIMAAAAKLASESGTSTPELIFFRNLFSLPLIIGWMLVGPGLGAIRTRRPGAHLTRGAIGLVSMTLTFQALIMLPLAEATTIGFAAPLFATMLSALLLAERVGRHRWAAVLFGFLGVLVVMRPGGGQGDEVPTLGLLVAIAGAVGVSAVTITVRQIGATESTTTTVLWFNILALLVTGAWLLLLGRGQHDQPWVPLAVMGVIGGAAQMLMTQSLRLAPVAVLAPFDYLQLPFALLLGWALWNDLPAWTTVAGGLLIGASGLYTVWREHRRHRDEREPATPPIR